jgi:hypothetical protein
MDEREPVDDSEFVFRRIHPIYYNSALPVPVQPEAFRPSRNDATGLSVLRARFALPQDTVANRDPAKVGEYYVARISVRALRDLGLSVNPEPVANGPPGHAVIPELSWPAYEADKQRLKLIQLDLAKLASVDIVYPTRTH